MIINHFSSQSRALKWPNCILKLSGFFLGGGQQGLNPQRFIHIATQLKVLIEHGARIVVVIGGGNILRGAQENIQENSLKNQYLIQNHEVPLRRMIRDRMGMLATCLNGFRLQQACLDVGLSIPPMISSIAMAEWIETDMKKIIQDLYLAPGIVISVGGAGVPYLSTDTLSVIRALECGFTWVLKATQVSGVFSEDPLTHSHAIYYPKISYEDVIGKKLCVMDPEAISLAQRHEVKIVVFRCDETIPSLWKIMTESDIPYTIIE